ncbi:hypothetical protein SAMN05421670_1090 [Psychrobacillus psychrotolerans]|uniref:Uncharacterized protein n=1 Tax=Psychrobacillus psychrotolerans TaxID=126156 RepID=A0A1I5W3W9_9BACI|nr:hypothetical protein [Psychrobacillus psychrotolerans]SFQ14428.1 hypothetical protein SAMN05421670_1090 [Psychrobacillus psychrotolerans]
MKKKRKKRKALKYFFLIILIIFLFFGLMSCAKDMEIIKKEKAEEFISYCENPYAFWKGVNGKSCDDARKTYYEYTDEEWKKAKRSLIETEGITEDDYLSDVIKEERQE